MVATVLPMRMTMVFVTMLKCPVAPFPQPATTTAMPLRTMDLVISCLAFLSDARMTMRATLTLQQRSTTDLAWSSMPAVFVEDPATSTSVDVQTSLLETATVKATT